MTESQINLDDLDKFVTLAIERLKIVKTKIQTETYPKPNYLYNEGGTFRNLGLGISIFLTNKLENVDEYQNFMVQFGRPLEGKFNNNL